MLESASLSILQHSLGLDRYGRGASRRNHYVAGGDDVPRCRALVAMGYMIEHAATVLSGGNPVFAVTRAGIKAVANESPSPPKLTRSQRRYQDYLAVADCFNDFRHYLHYLTAEQEKKRLA